MFPSTVNNPVGENHGKIQKSLLLRAKQFQPIYLIPPLLYVVSLVVLRQGLLISNCRDKSNKWMRNTFDEGRETLRFGSGMINKFWNWSVTQTHFAPGKWGMCFHWQHSSSGFKYVLYAAGWYLVSVYCKSCRLPNVCHNPDKQMNWTNEWIHHSKASRQHWSSDSYYHTWIIMLNWQLPVWSCVYLCVMQVTVIPLSECHHPQAAHCKVWASRSLSHNSPEGEGRKLPHITTPVSQFLMAAPPAWPDRVWHMLQWRLTGRQTLRNIRGALALKQSIVKGNPALPMTHLDDARWAKCSALLLFH